MNLQDSCSRDYVGQSAIFGVSILRVGSGKGEESRTNSGASRGSVHGDLHLQPKFLCGRPWGSGGAEQAECPFISALFQSEFAISKSQPRGCGGGGWTMPGLGEGQAPAAVGAASPRRSGGHVRGTYSHGKTDLPLDLAFLVPGLLLFLMVVKYT